MRRRRVLRDHGGLAKEGRPKNMGSAMGWKLVSDEVDGEGSVNLILMAVGEIVFMYEL